MLFNNWNNGGEIFVLNFFNFFFAESFTFRSKNPYIRQKHGNIFPFAAEFHLVDIIYDVFHNVFREVFAHCGLDFFFFSAFN